MKYFIFFTTALMICTSAVAQDEPTGRAEPILHGFVPEPQRLQLVTGDELRAKYTGRTIAGIYDVTRHSDQRYVETLAEDGRISYRERKFSSEGIWFVREDNLCFVYDEQPGREHCFYEFTYGDCVISYSSHEAVIQGRPLFPSQWSSVQKIVSEDFSWPDVPASETDEFTCFLSFV